MTNKQEKEMLHKLNLIDIDIESLKSSLKYSIDTHQAFLNTKKRVNQ